MDPREFQTSFIPKKPITPARPTTKKTVSLFSFLATIILLASIISAGGVYLYGKYLNTKVKDQGSQLTRAQKAFEPSLIDQMVTLDKRLSAAKTVLSKHIAISPIFTALSELTLPSIRYTKFDYVQDEKVNRFIVNLTGEASSYRDIALQSDLFGRNKYLQNPIFSNLKLNEGKGSVTFDLQFTVDPSFVSYQEVLSKTPALNGANTQ